ADGAAPARRSGALSAMKVAELQGLASSLGITGTGKMRKSDLIDAIKARQSGTSPAGGVAATGTTARRAERSVETPRRRVDGDSQEPSREAPSTEQRSTEQRSGTDRATDARDGDRRDGDHRARQGDQRQDGQDRQGDQRQDGQGGQRHDRQDRQDRQGDQR